MCIFLNIYLLSKIISFCWCSGSKSSGFWGCWSCLWCFCWCGLWCLGCFLGWSGLWCLGCFLGWSGFLLFSNTFLCWSSIGLLLLSFISCVDFASLFGLCFSFFLFFLIGWWGSIFSCFLGDVSTGNFFVKSGGFLSLEFFF